jgi:hypothetical protein
MVRKAQKWRKYRSNFVFCLEKVDRWDPIRTSAILFLHLQSVIQMDPRSIPAVAKLAIFLKMLQVNATWENDVGLYLTEITLKREQNSSELDGIQWRALVTTINSVFHKRWGIS